MSPNPKILRYQELAERIADLIRHGTYPPGERVPSVRQMSREQNLSISTVLEAYSLLERQGLIEARPQSGYYVRAQTDERLPEPETSSPQRDPSHVSLHELVMMLMRDSDNPNLVQLGAALPHLDQRLIQTINTIIARLVRQHGVDAHQYLFPPGLDALRVQIARRMVSASCSLSPAVSWRLSRPPILAPSRPSKRMACAPWKSPPIRGMASAWKPWSLPSSTIPSGPCS
jgi:DNA-binding transcriptional MocR family regulator